MQVPPTPARSRIQVLVILSQAKVQARRPKRKLRLRLGRAAKMSLVITAKKKDIMRTNAQNPKRATGVQAVPRTVLPHLPLLVVPGVLPHLMQAKAPPTRCATFIVLTGLPKMGGPRLAHLVVIASSFMRKMRRIMQRSKKLKGQAREHEVVSARHPQGSC